MRFASAPSATNDRKLALGTVEIVNQDLALCDERQRRAVVRATDRPGNVVAEPRGLRAALLDLRFELVPHVENPRDGLLELGVLPHALVDGLFIDRARVALLAVADPSGESSAHETTKACQETPGTSG